MGATLKVKWFGKEVQAKVARGIGKRFEEAAKKTKYYIMARLNVQNQEWLNRKRSRAEGAAKQKFNLPGQKASKTFAELEGFNPL